MTNLQDFSSFEALETVYDTLNDEEKQMFLDAACFFDGEDETAAVRTWEACGWNSRKGLETLKTKSLLESRQSRKTTRLTLEDHVRDFGREIADKQKRLPRRVWRWDSTPLGRLSFLELMTAKGADRLRFFRTMPESERPTNTTSSLQVFVADDNDENRQESRDLLSLQWKHCPHKSLPPWLPTRKLRVLEIHKGNLETLWRSETQTPLELRQLVIVKTPITKFPKSLARLQHLEKFVFNGKGNNISHLPEEICGLEGLKRLELIGFAKLSCLPKRIGDLKQLLCVIMVDCNKLKALPASFVRLTRLEHLELGCGGLEELAPDFGDLVSLEILRIQSAIRLRSLPDSMGNLKKLRVFELDGCVQLKSLPESLGRLNELQRLEIKWSGVTHLPKPVGQLKSRLQTFVVESIVPLTWDSD